MSEELVRIRDPYGPDDERPHPDAVFDGTIMDDDEGQPDGFGWWTAWAIPASKIPALMAELEDGDALQITLDWTGHRTYEIALTVASI